MKANSIKFDEVIKEIILNPIFHLIMKVLYLGMSLLFSSLLNWTIKLTTRQLKFELPHPSIQE